MEILFSSLSPSLNLANLTHCTTSSERCLKGCTKNQHRQSGQEVRQVKETVYMLESEITSEDAPIAKGLKGTRVPSLSGLHIQLRQFVLTIRDEGAIYLHAAQLESLLA